MTRDKLIEQIWKKKSVLCVGLDSDIHKLPAEIEHSPEGVLEFNKKIIDVTKKYAVSYKINTAFYESLGYQGWKVLEQTLEYIPDDIFTIADAKRGDIGNTADQYALAFLETMDFDSITVNPYMGIETISPYTTRVGKWAIVLGLTSNPGSQDIERMTLSSGKTVYEHTLDLCVESYTSSQLMMVVGATQGESIRLLRQRYPDYFFLVPGIGAQGGDLHTVLEMALHPEDAALLVNVSRAIIFAPKKENQNWLEAVEKSAASYQESMSSYLST